MKLIAEDVIPAKIVGKKMLVSPFPSNLKITIKEVKNKPHIVTKIIFPRKSLRLFLEKANTISQVKELVDAVIKSRNIKANFNSFAELGSISYYLKHPLNAKIDSLLKAQVIS